MLLLQAEVVAEYAPSFRRMLVHLMSRLAQVCQFVLLLEVPQASAVDLHAFEAVRLHLLD